DRPASFVTCPVILGCRSGGLTIFGLDVSARGAGVVPIFVVSRGGYGRAIRIRRSGRDGSTAVGVSVPCGVAVDLSRRSRAGAAPKKKQDEQGVLHDEWRVHADPPSRAGPRGAASAFLLSWFQGPAARSPARTEFGGETDCVDCRPVSASWTDSI